MSLAVRQKRPQQAMSAEDDLLRSCLVSITRDQPPAHSAFADISWDVFLARAEQHQLLPIAADALTAWALPPNVKMKLRSATLRRRMRIAVMTEEMVRIAQHLAQNGIQSIPLKGASLAYQVYARPTQRYFDDLDILVPAKQARDAAAALQTLGYAPHPRAGRDWHHLHPLTHPKHGTTVELHTDLIRRPKNDRGTWHVDQLWVRSQQSELAGSTLQTLDPVDALVYCALHARHHLFHKITGVLDTALLVNWLRENGVAWDEIWVRSAEAGATNALIHLLNCCEQLGLLSELPAKRGGWLSQKVAQCVGGWQTFDEPSTSIQDGILPTMLELGLMDSSAEAIAMLRTLLNPDQTFVGEEHNSNRARIWKRLKVTILQLFGRSV